MADQQRAEWWDSDPGGLPLDAACEIWQPELMAALRNLVAAPVRQRRPVDRRRYPDGVDMIMEHLARWLRDLFGASDFEVSARDVVDGKAGRRVVLSAADAEGTAFAVDLDHSSVLIGSRLLAGVRVREIATAATDKTAVGNWIHERAVLHAFAPPRLRQRCMLEQANGEREAATGHPAGVLLQALPYRKLLDELMRALHTGELEGHVSADSLWQGWAWMPPERWARLDVHLATGIHIADPYTSEAWTHIRVRRALIELPRPMPVAMKDLPEQAATAGIAVSAVAHAEVGGSVAAEPPRLAGPLIQKRGKDRASRRIPDDSVVPITSKTGSRHDWKAFYAECERVHGIPAEWARHNSFKDYMRSWANAYFRDSLGRNSPNKATIYRHLNKFRRDVAENPKAP